MAPHPPPSRALADIAQPDGTFAIVAMDQRNTLRRMLAAVDRPQTETELREFKADAASALADTASGLLLDPDFGVPAAVTAGLSERCGILVAAEPAERGNFNGEPHASRLPSQDAAWVRAMGGHAVKFLVQMHPGRPVRAGEPDLIADVVEVVRAVVEDCHAVGLPSVVENLIYPLPGSDDLTPSRRSDLIIESARILDDIGPDLLKLEYPGDAASCRKLADTITRPWAVLSAGVAFEEFTDVLRVSCDEGGASGFIAGRAIWKDAVAMEGAGRRTYLADVGRRRLEGCVEAIAGRARPWTSVG